VAFSIPQGSSKFWMQRLKTLEVPVDSYTSERFGETVVTLRDPDFLTIELVESANDPRPNGAERFGVPSEYALKGFHSVTALEQTIDSTESVLTKTMELAALDTESNRKRFAAGDQKSGMLIDIVLRPEMQRGTQGAGSVHHVAFRTPNDSTHAEMLEIVTKAGYQTSGIIDRDYFHSIYFREPGGVLFEIATDPPGMTVNEPLEKLGHDLLLPDRYEPHRKEIEMSLPRLVLPESGKVVGAL
jgi:glyoxalase family protein